MAKSEVQEPVFVNLQVGVVQVFNEQRRPVRVAPWANRNRGQDGIFEVKGEHYRQFVSAKGPLFPRPAGVESAAPAPSAGGAAGAGAGAGDKTPDADAGRKTKEDAPPADLSGYTVDGAEELIAATKDVALLKAWVEAEVVGDDRKGVKEAVEKQLAELG